MNIYIQIVTVDIIQLTYSNVFYKNILAIKPNLYMINMCNMYNFIAVAYVKFELCEVTIMKEISVRVQRFNKVLSILKEYNTKSVIEFGCGSGSFLPYIKKIDTIKKIGVIDKNEKKTKKIANSYPGVNVYNNSFLRYCSEFLGYDSVVAIEVIEHLTETELNRFIEIIFVEIRPRIVIFTTPNFEYNVNYPILFNGLRQKSHHFEFSPHELYEWGNRIVEKFNSYIYYTDFCDKDKSSQIIVFLRRVI